MMQNTDLNNIVTSVKVKQLTHLLKTTGYDKKETEYLVTGFSNGFDLEYRGSFCRTDTSPNLPFHQGVG